MNKKKKNEKGSLSGVIYGIVAVLVCAFGITRQSGFLGIIATAIAMFSLGINVHAYVKKKKAGGGSKASPVIPVRAESAPRRERKNEMPDTVPVKRNVSHTYAQPHQPQSEDYTRRRLEQLKRFLDAGLIDKAEYETEKQKIGR